MSKKPASYNSVLIWLSIFIAAYLFVPLSLHAKERATGLKGHHRAMSFEVWARNDARAEKIAASSENFYKRLLKDLKYGGMLKKRCRIYIFDSRQAFLRHMEGKAVNATYAGALAFPRRPQKNPEVYGYECDGLLEYILPHELTHQIYREFVLGIDITSPVPIWINEGMACYEEHNSRYMKTAKAAVDSGNFIGLNELFHIKQYPVDQNKNALFYAESTSVVEFLITTYGGRKFLNFSRKLIKSKKPVDAALKAVYYPHIRNTEELQKAWLKFVKAAKST